MNLHSLTHANFKTRKILLVAGLIFSSMAAFSLKAQADTTLFEISKGKQKLYLGGTIHFLRAQDFPAPAEFESAYSQSEKLVFETDLKNAQSPEFGKKFTQAMILPNNQTLKDLLDEKTWKELQDYAAQNNYPLSQTMMFNPAFTSVLITVTALQKMQVTQGVDNIYYQKATEDHKVLGELETGDQAIASMLAFDQDNPNQIIRQTLSDINTLQDDFSSLIDAWRKGDLQTLDKSLSEKMRNNLPKGYQALVVERNKLWLPQIEAMLNTPEVEMILVGSLHLSGDQGLLALLKKDGYKIKPVHLPKKN